MKHITDKHVEVVYECRDLGYGVERGITEGMFTGEVDTWGKFTFQPDQGETLYLFEDEIVYCEPVEQESDIEMERRTR